MADAQPIDILFDAVNGFQRTAVLRCALELDLFTAIAEGADTPAALASRCRASQRGLRMLCDRLVIDGFLHKDADGRYAVDESMSMYLDRRSPIFVGSMVEFMAGPLVVEAFARLTEAVRGGGTALDAGGTVAAEHPEWVQFARAMAPAARVQATVLANLLDGAPVRRVLDVAAGHGMFGITVADRHPDAQVTALDWAPVLTVAEENARAAGLAARWRALPGDAFGVDWGNGYDVVLLTHLLHHFDPAGCETLLRRAHAALVPGGTLVVAEFVPNDDRVTPRAAAAFSLTMLATTPAGDAYTFAEYRALLERAGFREVALHDLTPAPTQAIVARR